MEASEARVGEGLRFLVRDCEQRPGAGRRPVGDGAVAFHDALLVTLPRCLAALRLLRMRLRFGCGGARGGRGARRAAAGLAADRERDDHGDGRRGEHGCRDTRTAHGVPGLVTRRPNARRTTA